MVKEGNRNSVWISLSQYTYISNNSAYITKESLVLLFRMIEIVLL